MKVKKTREHLTSKKGIHHSVHHLHSHVYAGTPAASHSSSIKNRFIIFFSALFLVIFIGGSVTFIILMSQIRYENAKQELTHIIETEQHKLEMSINNEIAIALRMAESPLIQMHFKNPGDEYIKQVAFKEIAGYRRLFTGKNVFWISDKDKKYYFNDEYVYTLNPSDTNSWWYNSIMRNPYPYSLMINFDVELKKTMLWIDVPVFNDNQKPVGILGTGVAPSDFINIINYNKPETEDELYIFNSSGKIIKAKDIDLVDKASIPEVLGKTGEEILAKIKELKTGEAEYFMTKNKRQIVAVNSITVRSNTVSSIPISSALNLYITVTRPFNVIDSLKTGMTVLFGVMMAIIFLSLYLLIFLLR